MTVEEPGPVALARRTASAAPPLLVGLDVDGVLAPIVERADQAALLPGVATALERLADRIAVAVVSGRSVADLEQRFSFGPAITVVGSHGLETRDAPPLELGPDDRRRLEGLTRLADEAASAAGDGAWVEHKPASVVLHVREADPARGAAASAALLDAAGRVDGAHVKSGHAVVELMAVRTSKATAIERLRHDRAAATVVFVGDDRTDEEVFATLGDGDVSIRVGGDPTQARYRLRDPDEVRTWLEHLLAELGGP